MFRYVILGWDWRSDVQVRLASRMLERFDRLWTRAFTAPGLCVLHAGERPQSSAAIALADGRGVILGKLFHRATCAPLSASELDARESRSLVGGGGQVLMVNYWGRYVAILQDPVTHDSWLLRDPTGALPCFMTEIGAIRVVFSDIQDVQRLPGASWSIDWQYMAGRVTSGRLARATGATGLIGVRRVPPGESLGLSGGSTSRKRLWNAAAIATANPIEDTQAAAAAIHDSVRQSVWAWASCYPRLLHLLSGGFDSSVVLGCLASAPARPEVTCLNYFSDTFASDERQQARLVAGHFGVELLELEKRGSAVRLERVLDVRRSPVPWSYPYYVEHSAQQGALARERGADGIFSGVGGDQIFLKGSLPLAATDLLHRRGVRCDFFRYCLDIARVQGKSFWAVVCQALQGLRGWNPASEAGHGRMLVSNDLAKSVQGDERYQGRHPGLDARVGSGKQLHIHSIDLGHEFYDPLGGEDYPERTRPLVSQPLIETCLRIPTYVLAANGIDRSSARRAFSRDLPAPIVHRQLKGAMDSHAAQVFRANMPFLRELMLDGLLIRERLLDRARIEETLFRPQATFSRAVVELVTVHLSFEVWARGWTS